MGKFESIIEQNESEGARPITVGEKIQELLDWSGLSQKNLAKLVGMSPSAINGFIKGKKISLEAVDKIAQALHVNRWLLLNNEALPPSPLELTERETRLIIKYRSLPEEEEKMVDFAVDSIGRMYRHYRVISQDPPGPDEERSR